MTLVDIKNYHSRHNLDIKLAPRPSSLSLFERQMAFTNGPIKSHFINQQAIITCSKMRKTKTCPIAASSKVIATPRTNSNRLEMPSEAKTFLLSRSLIKRSHEIPSGQGRVMDIVGNGKFGKFGGIFVPEILITCLRMLEAEFKSVLNDPQFKVSQISIYFSKF